MATLLMNGVTDVDGLLYRIRINCQLTDVHGQHPEMESPSVEGNTLIQVPSWFTVSPVIDPGLR